MSPTVTSPAEPNSITMDAPWGWLAAGWRDLARAPFMSIGYGLLVVVGGALVIYALYLAKLASLIPVVLGAFAIVGPLLAVGLYEMSRRAFCRSNLRAPARLCKSPLSASSSCSPRWSGRASPWRFRFSAMQAGTPIARFPAGIDRRVHFPDRRRVECVQRRRPRQTGSRSLLAARGDRARRSAREGAGDDRDNGR